MLKKITVLSLALLYTVTALGFAVNFHYCFGEVSTIAINQPAKNCTTKKLVKLPKCCKSTTVELKVKDGHQFTAVTFNAKIFPLALLYRPAAFIAAPQTGGLTTAAITRGPPDEQVTAPVYLLNCNFRI